MPFVGFPASADIPVKPPTLEVVKQHSDIEVFPDGSYVETRENVLRLTSEASVQALRHLNFSYTEGYQQVEILSAYTQKADGKRIDVPQRGVLRGYGASSAPGFQDLKTIDVVFPSVEVGDEIAITSVFRQTRPWFENQFAGDWAFSPMIPTQDGSVSLTAPEGMKLQLDNLGLEEDPAEHANGKIRRSWHYRNKAALPNESDVVDSFDTGPRVVASAFTDYAQVAQIYRQLIHGKADVTPDVKALADKIVAGIADRKAQAGALYDWVSAHIAYVNIVLGAGGFVPHDASAVLKTQYGDCKDHAVILSALLAAEGIVSTPVLIDASNRFQVPKAASPFVFNHMINYVPEFHLYLDSTARYAPFGQLPLNDAGKPVVNVMTGDVTRTPNTRAQASTVHATETVTIARDGSADGKTHVTATGAFAMDTRSYYHLLEIADEPQFFSRVLGPGASGSFDKGNANSREEPYAYGAEFHIPNAANMPGPGALSSNIGFEGFYPAAMIAADLPPARSFPYMCPSATADNELTLNFPKGTSFASIPQPVSLAVEGVSLKVSYKKPAPATVHIVTSLVMDHPNATCDPAYYARVRPALAKMIAALHAQIIYRVKDAQ